MKDIEQAATDKAEVKDSSVGGDQKPMEQADYHGEGKALIDKKLRKKFGKRMTSGDVEDFNPETKLYKVRFADDSTEQIAWPELKNLLPQEPKRFPRRKKEANPEVAPDAGEEVKKDVPDEGAHLEETPEMAHLETTEKSGGDPVKLLDRQPLEEVKLSVGDENVSAKEEESDVAAAGKVNAADEQVEAANTGTEPNQEIKAAARTETVHIQEEKPAAETETVPTQEEKSVAESETVPTEEESAADTGAVQETTETAVEASPEEAPKEPAVPGEAEKGSQENEKAPEDADVQNTLAEKEVEAQKKQADGVVPAEGEKNKPTKASQQGADSPGKDDAENIVDVVAKDGGATGEEEKDDDEISDSDLEKELQARKKPKKRKANVLTLKRWRGYKKKRKEKAALLSDAEDKSAEGEAKDITVDAVEEAMPRRESRTRKLSEVEASPEAIKRQKLVDIAKQKKSEIKSMLRGSPAPVPPATPQGKAVEENRAEQNSPETAVKLPDEPKDVVPSAPTDAGTPDEAKPSPFDRGIKLRGRKLRKNFNGTLHRGEITDYDRRTRHYKIRYEDGEEEKLMWKDVGPLLVSWEEQATWDNPDSEPKEINGQENVTFENKRKPKLPKLTPLVRKRNR